MPKDIYTLRADSYAQVIDALPELVEVYKDQGLLVIKGYNFSVEEHKNLARLFGDNLNWQVNSSVAYDEMSGYFDRGGHSGDPNNEYNHSTDDYYLDWHIEQAHYKCPPLAGIWCMKEITCSIDAGNTLFADSNEIYESLSDEDKEFLAGAVACWDKPTNNCAGPFYTKAIDTHPFTSIPIIRMDLDRGAYMLPTLHSLYNRPALAHESERFEAIMTFVKTRLVEDYDLRYVQQWESGDIVVVDLFRMYHAVLGGFKYNQRVMDMIVARSPEGCGDVYNDPELLVG